MTQSTTAAHTTSLCLLTAQWPVSLLGSAELKRYYLLKSAKWFRVVQRWCNFGAHSVHIGVIQWWHSNWPTIYYLSLCVCCLLPLMVCQCCSVCVGDIIQQQQQQQWSFAPFSYSLSLSPAAAAAFERHCNWSLLLPVISLICVCCLLFAVLPTVLLKTLLTLKLST